jgi:hypothetical protein
MGLLLRLREFAEAVLNQHESYVGQVGVRLDVAANRPFNPCFFVHPSRRYGMPSPSASAIIRSKPERVSTRRTVRLRSPRPRLKRYPESIWLEDTRTISLHIDNAERVDVPVMEIGVR